SPGLAELDEFEPRLLVEHAAGHERGVAYDLMEGATLGRGDVEIRLDDPFASSRHARISREGQVVVIEDLGSTNGTYLNEQPSDGSPEERLADRAKDANRRIYEISSSKHEFAGMGTTLTAVYLDELDLAVAHVGDSRAYLFRDEKLIRLTQDHSLVDALVRAG